MRPLHTESLVHILIQHLPSARPQSLGRAALLPCSGVGGLGCLSQHDLPEDRHYNPAAAPFQCTATGISLAPLNITPATLLLQWETQEPWPETRASLLPPPPPALTHNCCSQNLPSTLLSTLFLTSTCSLLPSRPLRTTTDSFYFYYYSLTQSWTEEKQQEPTCKAIRSPQGLEEDQPQLSSCPCFQ